MATWTNSFGCSFCLVLIWFSLKKKNVAKPPKPWGPGCFFATAAKDLLPEKVGRSGRRGTGLRFCWKGGWKKWNILSPKWWFNMLESKKKSPQKTNPSCWTTKLSNCPWCLHLFAASFLWIKAGSLSHSLLVKFYRLFISGLLTTKRNAKLITCHPRFSKKSLTSDLTKPSTTGQTRLIFHHQFIEPSLVSPNSRKTQAHHGFFQIPIIINGGIFSDWGRPTNSKKTTFLRLISNISNIQRKCEKQHSYLQNTLTKLN